LRFNTLKARLTLLVFAFLQMGAKAHAITLGNREVELSSPVGSDILPGGGIHQDEIRTSFVFSNLIPFVIKYAIRLAVILAVAALIVGGFLFITSYGDTEKRTTAQKTIMWALIGLIIVMTAFGIVTIITNISFV